MSRMTWARWCCTALLGMAAYSSVPAQTMPEDSVVRDAHTLDEVVVSAAYATREATATSPFQQLARAQFDQQGVTDVADALRRFSGVNVKDYGGAGA